MHHKRKHLLLYLAPVVLWFPGCSDENSSCASLSEGSVAITVTGAPDCADYTLRFLDEDGAVLSAVNLGEGKGQLIGVSGSTQTAGSCPYSYRPPSDRSIDQVTVQVLDSEAAVLVEATAVRPHSSTGCTDDYQSVLVEIALPTS